ncbi:hypothetical protein JG688_00005473 [Phytophthora aleatoria]|uniref:Uncharacterized protein n=1 Tax=Phytophthora aleatoria TaxID=2496075 RepID=A0A8J5MGZ4_9STRA|nr:hypothetical protein JG688_00005473 [Phytophthora aleatoria]
MPPTTARKFIKRGAPDLKTRESALVMCTKYTPEMRDVLVAYLEENDLCIQSRKFRRSFVSTSEFN